MVKSLFIVIYPTLCLIAIVFGIKLLLAGNPFLGIGIITAAIPFLFFVGKAYLIWTTARTDENFIVASSIVGIGILISLFSIAKVGFTTMHLLPFFLGLLWLAYIRWYSRFDNRQNDLLTVGNILPNFQLENQDGESVSSQSLMNKKHIILFYRGNWCPLCMAQINEISSMYGELKQKGIETALISPQPHYKTKSIAKKFGVDFKYLVDKNNKAAKALGIFAKSGLPMGLQALGYDSDTVMPTVILTDNKGKIIYSDLTSNYRVRPEPQDFLKAFA